MMMMHEEHRWEHRFNLAHSTRTAGREQRDEREHKDEVESVFISEDPVIRTFDGSNFNDGLRITNFSERMGSKAKPLGQFRKFSGKYLTITAKKL